MTEASRQPIVNGNSKVRLVMAFPFFSVFINGLTLVRPRREAVTAPSQDTRSCLKMRSYLKQG